MAIKISGINSTFITLVYRLPNTSPADSLVPTEKKCCLTQIITILLKIVKLTNSTKEPRKKSCKFLKWV